MIAYNLAHSGKLDVTHHFDAAQFQQLLLLGGKIVDALTELTQTLTNQVAAWNAVSGQVDQIALSQSGLQADVTSLKQQITDLQSQLAGITEVPQAIQDQVAALNALAQNVVNKTTNVSQALQNLDNQTNPVTPPPPPAPPTP